MILVIIFLIIGCGALAIAVDSVRGKNFGTAGFAAVLAIIIFGFSVFLFTQHVVIK